LTLLEYFSTFLSIDETFLAQQSNVNGVSQDTTHPGLKLLRLSGLSTDMLGDVSLSHNS
jgi:hypothetical protein